MPNFAYSACDADGNKVSGTLTAADEYELEVELEKRHLSLVSAKVVHQAKEISFGRKKVSRKELIRFTMYLNTMISAGVPLLAGLSQIGEQAESPYFKQVIKSVSLDIQGGQKISDAMEKHPRAFNKLYTSVIKAGEASGKLEMILKDLIVFLEWQEELHKKIKKATMYPAILFCTVSSLVLVLVVFVFPQFMTMFDGLNIELPGPTVAVINVSDFVRNYWQLIFGSVIVLIASYKIAKRYPGGRYFIDKYKMELPIFGEMVAKVAISRFAHYLGLVLRAGVDITESLTIVQNLVGNEAIARVVQGMREMILGGKKVGEAMERYPVFPPLVVQMIVVGEMSGKLEQNLGKVSEFYDREVPEAIDKCLGTLQPLIIVVMAAVVITVALAIFLPMFMMGQSIRAH